MRSFGGIFSLSGFSINSFTNRLYADGAFLVFSITSPFSPFGTTPFALDFRILIRSATVYVFETSTALTRHLGFHL